MFSAGTMWAWGLENEQNFDKGDVTVIPNSHSHAYPATQKITANILDKFSGYSDSLVCYYMIDQHVPHHFLILMELAL